VHINTILYQFEFYSPENTRIAICTRIRCINTRIFLFWSRIVQLWRGHVSILEVLFCAIFRVSCYDFLTVRKQSVETSWDCLACSASYVLDQGTVRRLRFSGIHHGTLMCSWPPYSQLELMQVHVSPVHRPAQMGTRASGRSA
jgi:hypothetical protein